MRTYKLSETSWTIFSLLRFLLASIVVVSHIHFVTEVPDSLQKIDMLGGKAAVIGFLLISGISVGHSYLNSETGYLKRRFLRIYPLYFIAVIFTIFIQFLIGSTYQVHGQKMVSAGIFTSFANLFLLQGFLAITIIFNGPLWSISVEVFYYLILPFLNRLSTKIIYGLILVSMFFYMFTYTYFKFTLWGYVALIYAWAWLTGFLIARKSNMYAVACLILLGTFVLSYNQIIAVEAIGWLTFLGTAAMVIAAGYLNLKFPKRLQIVFNWLGEMSYPLYLFHFPLFLLLHYFGIKNAWAFVALALLAIVPINYIFDHWLKRVFWKPVANYVTDTIHSYQIRLTNK